MQEVKCPYCGEWFFYYCGVIVCEDCLAEGEGIWEREPFGRTSH